MEILLLFVFGIIFYSQYQNINFIRRRLDDLTSEVNNLKQGSIQKVLTTDISPASSSLGNQSVHLKDPSSVHTESKLLTWSKENTLSKIGVLLILLGFGWFVSYAFLHNWIGPVGRISIGFIAGIIVTVFGTYRLRKDALQGDILSILGTSIVTITSLASYYYYNFFPSYVVLFIVFFASLYINLTAVAWQREKLSIYGVFLSLIAPYISFTTDLDEVVLFSYLIVVALSSVWVNVVRNWRYPVIVSITGFLLYTLPHLSSVQILESKYLILSLIYLNVLIYLIQSIWKLIRSNKSYDSSDYFVSIVNNFVIITSVLVVVPTVYQSLNLAVWMIVYALAGYSIFTKTGETKLIFIHSLSAILFLSVATSAELSGQTLVIALAIESAIVTLASYVVMGNHKVCSYLSLTMIIPSMLSLPSFVSASWKTGIFHSDFAVLFVIMLIYATLGYFFYSNEKGGTKTDIQFYSIYLIISFVYLIAIIWLSNHFLFKPDMAVLISLFIYTAIGLYLYLTGVYSVNNLTKSLGAIILLVVVVRLILVDVWKMDLVFRVITFILIGTMFISTAFLSKSKSVQLPT
ncbi:MAG: DUF2339 domain-containing protein [Minisyncoccia bacterium]